MKSLQDEILEALAPLVEKHGPGAVTGALQTLMVGMLARAVVRSICEQGAQRIVFAVLDRKVGA